MEKHRSVEEYLKKLPKDQRSALQKIRKTIKQTAPGAEEKISYGMPGYKYKGYPLVYFAGFKNHLSFFPGRKLSAQYAKELEGLGAKVTGASTIQFPPDKPIPAAVVKKIVKMRMKENETRKGGYYTKKK